MGEDVNVHAQDVQPLGFLLMVGQVLQLQEAQVVGAWLGGIPGGSILGGSTVVLGGEGGPRRRHAWWRKPGPQ